MNRFEWLGVLDYGFLGSKPCYKNVRVRHTKAMLARFLFYGLLGWGMEVFWTGLHSLKNGDPRMVGSSSLLMFPIYGMVLFLEPLFVRLLSMPAVVRGGVYMICIFCAEYASGWYLQRVIGACPWDYSGSRFQIGGLIRLDYAPVWFCVGLIYERVFTVLSHAI